MGTIESKLNAMGYQLSPPFTFPKNNRTGCTQTGNLLLLSGHGLDLPKLPNVWQTSKFGVDITVEEGYATSSVCCDFSECATARRISCDRHR